jgi:hypothetical protein
MNPAVVQAFAQVVAAVVLGGGASFFALMCFPSFRGAVADRLRQRTLRHADATDVVAQLAALRGEVYALRTELAQTTRLVGTLTDHPDRLSLPTSGQGRPPAST